MTPAEPQDLDGALRNLSLCLEEPCVPGELEGWIKAVWEAVERARPLLYKHLTRNHQDHFASIVEEDTEMFRQVTLLKKEDQNILQHFHAVSERVSKLLEKAPRVGPNEAQLHEDVSGLITDGLSFVIQVQRQGIAIRTWLQEAFVRDRGVGD
ncbi:MAG TPA: hypothetical protein VKE98_09405 [Gemmataceae bacterium]|nr:hypothetical protein [Gemmataceae bacterium]